MSSSRRAVAPLLFLVDSLICQTAAIAVLVVTWQLTGSLPCALVTAPLTAVSGALFFALPLPWQLLNFLVLPAGALSMAVDIPGWIYLVLFISTLAIYLPAFWTRVPYYPTSSATYLMLLPELPKDEEFSFIDLGCGFGDLLLFLAKHRPRGRYTGVEIGILPCLVAKVRARVFGNGRVTIRYQSLWSTKLGDFDFVYTFLSPAPMGRIWEKVRSEMRPGSTYINNSFSVPEPAHRSVEVKDDRNATLYFHVMGK